MEISVDLGNLPGFVTAMGDAPARLDSEMQAARDVALMEGVGYAVDYAPKRSGALAGSITVLSQDGWGGRYGTGGLVYAWMREEGGTITGNPWLVFQVDGRWVRVRSVTQSGSHYMARSAESLGGRVDAIYGAAVDRALAGI